MAKCLIKSWRPSHVENLLHGPRRLLLGPRSHGPTVVHPSVQMCSKHSIASLSSMNNLCSSLCLLVLFFLCTPFHNFNLNSVNRTVCLSLIMFFLIQRSELTDSASSMNLRISSSRKGSFSCMNFHPSVFSTALKLSDNIFMHLT